MNQLEIYQPQQIGALFDDRKIELIKNTICKGASKEEFEFFLHACKRTGLDPIMKQIYAVKRWDSALKKESMTIQTGIDGYRLIAERTGRYSPGREPTYQYDDKGNIISSTAYIKKQTSDGTWHEVAATAFFNEYCQKTKEGKLTRFWFQLGHAMIAKCAEALALRKAFPGDLSGLYTKEEMMQADILIDEVDSSKSLDHVVDSNEMVNNQPKTSDKMVELQESQTSQPNKEHIEPSLEMVDNSSKMISESQWNELNSLINKCSDEYQTKVWEYLTSQEIFSEKDLNFNIYEKIRRKCLMELEIKSKVIS